MTEQYISSPQTFWFIGIATFITTGKSPKYVLHFQHGTLTSRYMLYFIIIGPGHPGGYCNSFLSM